MPRDRRRQRPPRERPDLQAQLRRAQAGEGRPGRGDATRNSPSSSSTRTSGTSARRGGCSRNGPRGRRPGQGVSESSRAILDDDIPTSTRRLRALWTLARDRRHWTRRRSIGLLDDRDESIRGWAVRLLVDAGAARRAALSRLVGAGAGRASPRVRLSLASALQRIPRRGPLAAGRGPGRRPRSIPTDPMLPLMTWYGIEPLAAADPAAPRRWRRACKLPLLRNYLARRIVTADAAEGLAALLPGARTVGGRRPPRPARGHPRRPPRPQADPRPEGWPSTFATLLSDAAIRTSSSRPCCWRCDPRRAQGDRDPAADRRRLDGARRPLRTAPWRPGRAPRAGSAARTARLARRSTRSAARRSAPWPPTTTPGTPQAILKRYAKLTEAERDDADRHALGPAGLGPGPARRGREQGASPAAT